MTRYRIKRRLARGGMAEVFLADDTERHRVVVVKRLLGALAGDAMFRQLFLDEARLALQLHHDNIVDVFDVGFEKNEYFIAMERVDGVDVEDLVDAGGPMSVGAAVHLTRQLLDALAYAHGLPIGIVHRDVNPGNVLVERTGRVKLCDFGIARCAEHIHKTAPGALIGKPGFMAPEQAVGARVDVRADVYGAATVLVYALTGKEPGATIGGVPHDLVDVIAHALADDPARRTSSARAFSDALAPFDVATGAHDLADVVARTLSKWPSASDANAPRTLGTPPPIDPAQLPTRLVRRSRDDQTVRLAEPPPTVPVPSSSSSPPTVRASSPELRASSWSTSSSSVFTGARRAMEKSRAGVVVVSALVFVTTFALVLAVRLLLR